MATTPVLITVDKVAMPNPSSMTWGLQDISDSEAGRSVSGYMYKGRVAQKVTIDLTWNAPSKEDIKTILTAFNPEYISVTYYDPMSGANETKDFYVGDRSAPVQIWTTNKQFYTSLSLQIIER